MTEDININKLTEAEVLPNITEQKQQVKVTEIKSQEIMINENESMGLNFEEDPIKPLLLKEISDFSPYCETITLSTLFALSHWKSVINISPRGQGKSRSTKELLDYLKVPYKEINGRITARALFEELTSDGIIVIDEAAQILSDREVQSILLSAMTGCPVSWETSHAASKHVFNGIIICNANTFTNSNEIRAAVLDRCLVNRINLNKTQILEKIKSEEHYAPKSEIWKVIVERLNLHRIMLTQTTPLCKFPGLFPLDPLKGEGGSETRSSGSTKKSKNNLFKALYDKSTQKRIDLQKYIREYLLKKVAGVTSMRPWDKIQYVADFSYNLLGDFSMVDTLLCAIKNSDEAMEIAKMEIPRPDKVKMIAKLKGYADLRNARKLLKKIEDAK